MIEFTVVFFAKFYAVIVHFVVPSMLHHVEKFFLSEVLALTGYQPPVSLFGGIFSSSGEQQVQSYDRF